MIYALCFLQLQDMSSLNLYIGNNKLVLLIYAPDLTASRSALKLAKSRFGMFKRAFN